MSAIQTIAGELLGMFWTDGWLAATTLGLVALVAGLAPRLAGQPIVAGGVLLFGCIGILVAVAWRAARQAVRS